MKKFYQCRNWCFTLFGKEDRCIDTLHHEIKSTYKNYNDIIRYICIGKETCPKTNKLHIQGWLQLVNKKTLGGVKKLLGYNWVHLEQCRGDEYSNEVYCKKDNDFWEAGKFITQGQRTDLEQIKKQIEGGKPMYQIANDYFGDFIRYFSGFMKYKQLVDEHKASKFRKVEVIVIQGTTGVGKTRMAMEKAKYKIEGDSLDWWDGYNGEDCILIDEYDNQAKCTKMLNILDGYKLRLPIKGAFTYANWTKVFITTNNPWEMWHTHAKEEHRKALRRRISKWIILS